MRVNFIGNTCNNHYGLCKFLRKAGVDAQLFYDRRGDIQTFPEAEDAFLADQPADWIHPYEAADVGPHPWHHIPPAFMARLADCDLLQAESEGLLWAWQSGKPYLWSYIGADLNFFPYHAYWSRHWKEATPEHLLTPLAYRRAIVGASAFRRECWYQPLRHGYGLLSRLLPPERFANIPGKLIDTELFTPGTPRPLAAMLADFGLSHHPEGLILFHPSRIMFTPKSYVNKANDRLYRALARLRRTGRSFTLILISLGPGNIDEPEARRLLDELGIADRVVWLPRKLKRHELREWYQIADLTADEFIGGSIGSISVETMACGTPLLSRLATEDPDPTHWSPALVYEELPPVINVSSEQEILDALIRFSDDRPALAALGTAGRRWTEENYSGQAVARRYQALFERVLASPEKPHLSAAAQGREPLPAIDPQWLPTLPPQRGQPPEDPSSPAVARRRLLDCAPDDPMRLCAVLEATARAGRLDLAINSAALAGQMLPQATPLAEKLAEFQLLRGMILLDQGHEEQGESDVQQACSSKRYRPLALAVLGRQASRRQCYEKARELLERSLALDARNREGLIGMAEVLLAQNDKAQALRIVSKGLRASPGDRQFLALLSRIES